jgi:hypothetical protein
MATRTTRSKPAEATEQIQVAFRLPADLVERIDRHAEHMSEQFPGIAFTRADAARTLLTVGLQHVEREHADAGTKRRGAR